MLTRQRGGMTEFIPSPQEKRDGVIRNHVLELLANLDARLRQIEYVAGIPTELADQFTATIERIKEEESHIQKLSEALLPTGAS